MNNAAASHLSCYRCGASLAALSLPLTRLDECPECLAQLHVCRMCVHYSPQRPSGCDEDDALEVRDKSSANFCDYFKPDPKVCTGTDLRAAAESREKLNALFGGSGVPSEPRRGTGAKAQSDPDAARRDAEALFKK